MCLKSYLKRCVVAKDMQRFPCLRKEYIINKVNSSFILYILHILSNTLLIFAYKIAREWFIYLYDNNKMESINNWHRYSNCEMFWAVKIFQICICLERQFYHCFMIRCGSHLIFETGFA